MKFYKLVACLVTLFFSQNLIAQNTLDQIGLTASTPANVAFSLRKLSSSYNAEILHVRRSTDNALAKVYFDVNGEVTANSPVELMPMSTLTLQLGNLKTGTISAGTSLAGTLSVQVNRTGTINASNSSTTVTGSGTLFLSELQVGDVLYNTSNELIGTVMTITSNTELSLNTNSAINNASLAFRNERASVTGVGTNFIVDFQVGDKLFNASNTFLGIVSAIHSTTSMELQSWNATAASNVGYKKTTNIITGSGTQFLSELQVGEMLVSNNSTIGVIASIESNTSLTLETTSSRALTNFAYRSTTTNMSFKDFYQGASVFVTRWNDQSGSGRFLHQLVTSQQPRIVFNSVPHTRNGKFAIQTGFSGKSYLHSEKRANWLDNTAFTINKLTTENTLNPGNMNVVTTLGGNGPQSRVLHFGYRNNNQLTLALYSNDANFNSVSTTELELHTAVFTNPGSTMFRNGGNLGSNNSPTTSLTTPGHLIFGYYSPTNTGYNGFLTELIAFNYVLTEIERTTIENNQITYYGIVQSIWTGAIDSDWHKAGNWQGGIPNLITPSVVIIPNTFVKPVIASGAAQARSLTLETGATLTITNDATLKLRGALNGANGAVNALNGRVEFDGSTGLDVPITFFPTVFLNNTIKRLIINSSNDVQLSNGNITVSDSLIFTLGRLRLNEQTLTIGGAVLNTVGQNIRGSSNSRIILNNNADIELSFDQSTLGTTNLIRSFTVNSGSKKVTLLNHVALGQDNLDIQSGILDIGANTIHRTAAGGILNLGANAKLMIGGTGSIPQNYTTHTFATTSIVDFYGTNQTITALNSSQNYGTLLLSGSGVKTFQNSITIEEILNVTSGVKMNLGTFSHTTGSLTLNSINQITGTYGGLTSSATYINPTFFEDNTGLIAVNFSETIWTGATSENWHEASNWSDNFVPSIINNVTIPGTAIRQPTISANAQIRNLILDNNAILTNNDVFRIAGNITNISSEIQGIGTIQKSGISRTISGDSLNLLNLILLNNSSTTLTGNHSSLSLVFESGNSGISLLLNGTSKLSISGNLDINQSTSNSVSRTLNINNGKVIVGGNLSFLGTNNTTSRIQEIIIANGQLEIEGNLIMANVSNTSRRIVMSAGAGSVSLKGNMANMLGTQTLTAGTAGSTFIFAGSSAQNMRFFSSGSYHNLLFDNPTQVTIPSAISPSNVTGNITVNQGQLKNGGFNIVGNASRVFLLKNGSSLEVSGTSTIPTGFGTITFEDNTNVIHTGTSAQTVRGASYFNLTIEGNRGANNITLQNGSIIDIRNSIIQNATFSTGNFVTTNNTVRYSMPSSSQNVANIPYNNLMLTGASQKFAQSDLTVNGVLNLAANISSDRGHLEMTISYDNYANQHDTNSVSIYNNLNSYILNLGSNATITGVGDVTGKIRRTSFVNNQSYAFGNNNMRITLIQNAGSMPTQMTVVSTIGSHGLHVDKDGINDYTPNSPDTLIGGAAIKRLYQILRTGGTSAVRFTVRFPYLQSELNGNNEANLVTWDHHLPYGGMTPHEHGKTSNNTLDNWVELSNHGLFYLSQEGDTHFTKYWMLSQKVTKDTLWMGATTDATAGDWNTALNWSSGAVPTSLSRVIIDPNIYKSELVFTGTISTGSIEIKPNAVVHGGSATINLNGGPVINGGAGTWLNNGYFDRGTSTVNFNSNNGTIAGKTHFHNFSIGSGKTLTVQSNAIDSISGSFTNNGTLDAGTNLNTFVFLTPDFVINQPNGNRLGFYNLTLSGSGTHTVNNNLTIQGNLILNNGTLNLSNKTTEIFGDFTNNSTVDASTSTFIFNTASNQKIDGLQSTTFYNFEKKGIGSLSLRQAQKIKNQLSLSKGNILSTFGSYLEVGEDVNTTANIVWSEGSIVGPLKRWYGTEANLTTEKGLLPVGTIDNNKSAKINFTEASNGGYIVIEYKEGNPDNDYDLPLAYLDNGQSKYIQNADKTGYWDITPYDQNGTPYASLDETLFNISLRLNNPAVTENNPLNDPPSMRIIRAKGNPLAEHDDWVVASSVAKIDKLVEGYDYVVTSYGLKGFSWFNIGGDNETPLPIELKSFAGACNNEMVVLTWETASENNSNFFILQSSRDAINWYKVDSIQAAGFSTSLQSYKSFQPISNAIYYRLKQVDFNGEEKIYGPIYLNCEDEYSQAAFTFPNPSKTDFYIKLVSNSEGLASVRVKDINGKNLFENSYTLNNGINLLNVNKEFPTGMYLIEMTLPSGEMQIIRHSVN